MQYRVLKAVSAMAALVPALAIAQQRPATPPPSQPRPAATPAQRPAATPARPMMPMRHMGPHREHAWQFGIQGGVLILDQTFNSFLQLGVPFKTSTSRIMPGGAVSLTKQLGSHVAFGIGSGFFTSSGAKSIAPRAELTFSTDINKSTVFFVPVGGNRFH